MIFSYTPTESESNSEINENLFQSVINFIYPIGSLYITTLNVNPKLIFHFGEWEAFGEGRTLVGVNTSDSSFSTVEKTGGEKTHVLTQDELPAHNHGETQALTGSVTFRDVNTGNHDLLTKADGKFQIDRVTWEGSHDKLAITTTGNNNLDVLSMNVNHQHSTVGKGQAHNNMPPYITVYMWKRIK